MRSFRKVGPTHLFSCRHFHTPFSINRLVDLHESNILVACYGLDRLPISLLPIIEISNTNYAADYLEIRLFKMFASETKIGLLFQNKNTFCCLRSKL